MRKTTTIPKLTTEEAASPVEARELPIVTIKKLQAKKVMEML